MLIKILMPNVGTNDDSVLLAEWFVENYQKVTKGENIACLESTKSAFELPSESDGFIKKIIEAGQEALIGEVIALIADNKTELDNAIIKNKVDNNKELNINATKKAIELAKKHNINLADIKVEGIIKEKDVLSFLPKQNKPIIPKKDEIVEENDILIICGGGLAKMCIDSIQSVNFYSIKGIVDPGLSVGSKIMGIEVIGDDDVLPEKYLQGYKNVVNAMGSISGSNSSKAFMARKNIYKNLKKIGFSTPNIIHPKAIVEKSATFGEGNIIFAGAYIGSEASIGNDTIINNHAIVSHDCKIGNHVRLSPNCTLAGNVEIGENSLIGMGVNVYIGIKIGKNVIISNGKNIFADVPDNSVIK